MSHTDYISEVPKGYKIVASSTNCPCAAMENEKKNIYAVQFHPEVTHSEYGNNILHNFLYEICNCEGNWVMDNFIDNTIKELKKQIRKLTLENQSSQDNLLNMTKMNLHDKNKNDFSSGQNNLNTTRSRDYNKKKCPLCTGECYPYNCMLNGLQPNRWEIPHQKGGKEE